MNYIHDAGYGNRTPDEFRKLLVDAGVDVVFDVRRDKSHARIGSYNPGQQMAKTLCGNQILVYKRVPQLGNYASSLSEYSLNGKTDYILQIAEFLIHWNFYSPCFICCERNAYKNNGKANCHRVHVADAVAEELRKLTGKPWGIEHL